MAEALREWVQSLGIREASAVDAVVAMCQSQGCHTPNDAAGTATKQIFSEARLKELLAGQKMNVRKKFYNGLERLGGRDSPGLPTHSLASPDAPISATGVANPPNVTLDTSGSPLDNTSPVGSGIQPSSSASANPRSPSPDWSSGDRALVREIFEIFNKSGNGRLNHSEYAAFCAATEAGASCSEDRWRMVRGSAT